MLFRNMQWLASAVFAVLGSTLVSAEPLTPFEIKIFSLESAMVMDVSMLDQSLGPGYFGEFSYTGIIGDAGWSAQLMGNYGGLPVSIAYHGAYDLMGGLGMFTASGTIGTGTYN